jgi:hypothetical protein
MVLHPGKPVCSLDDKPSIAKQPEKSRSLAGSIAAARAAAPLIVARNSPIAVLPVIAP